MLADLKKGGGNRPSPKLPTEIAGATEAWPRSLTFDIDVQQLGFRVFWGGDRPGSCGRSQAAAKAYIFAAAAAPALAFKTP